MFKKIFFYLKQVKDYFSQLDEKGEGKQMFDYV